ncbi:MAG: hypothetical protein AAF432_04220 [Planctomycetota bacterium]
MRMLLAIGLLSAMPVMASAVEVEYTFGGTIDSGVLAPIPGVGVLQSGAEFEVKLRFDTEASDMFPDTPSIGWYTTGLATVNVDGLPQLSGTMEMFVEAFTAEPAFFVFGPFDQGDPLFFQVIVPLPGKALPSDAPPLTLPFEQSIDPFIMFQNEPDQRGTITSFSSQVIPAPAASLLLLGAGLRRRRRRP